MRQIAIAGVELCGATVTADKQFISGKKEKFMGMIQLCCSRRICVNLLCLLVGYLLLVETCDFLFIFFLFSRDLSCGAICHVCKLNSANCNLDADETAGAAGDHSSQSATHLSEN